MANFGAQTGHYQVNGTDLDSIFNPIGAGSPGTPTGYSKGSQDFASRYQALQPGGDIGFDTNYKVQGTDLRYIFQKAAY